MKSSISVVRAAIKNSLQSVGNSSGFGIYDRPRKIKDYPHVIIGQITEQQEGDQGEFGQIVTVNIEIYDGFDSDYGERSKSEDILSAIMVKLITKPISLVVGGFTVCSLVADNTMSNTEQTATKTIVTTVLRIKMQLFEQ